MGVYRLAMNVLNDDGSREVVPVEIPDSMVGPLVDKADRDDVPLDVLIADFAWHCVADIKGGTEGWSLPPVRGYTLPLPRANGRKHAWRAGQ